MSNYVIHAHSLKHINCCSENNWHTKYKDIFLLQYSPELAATPNKVLKNGNINSLL